MIKLITLLLFLFTLNETTAQNVGIGTTTPNSNAALEIKSNTKGILIPRISQASKILMPNVAKGMMVYDTTNSAFYYHDGNIWRLVSETNYNGLLNDQIDNPQVIFNMLPGIFGSSVASGIFIR